MCNPVTTAHPDVLLAKGVHEGYEWEVTSNRLGYRCGYVRVPQGHPWHGQGYDDVRTAGGDWPDVHGGLTFAEADTDCGKGGEDSAWWLGFDCAHAGDAPDPELPGSEVMMRHGLAPATLDQFTEMYDHGYRDVVRSTEYVAAECRKLADQAAAAG
jgi:hypothetical protein